MKARRARSAQCAAPCSPPSRRHRPNRCGRRQFRQADRNAWWRALEAAVQNGSVRDDDLLLDPSYRPLRSHKSFADLLRLRREFRQLTRLRPLRLAWYSISSADLYKAFMSIPS